MERDPYRVENESLSRPDCSRNKLCAAGYYLILIAGIISPPMILVVELDLLRSISIEYYNRYAVMALLAAPYVGGFGISLFSWMRIFGLNTIPLGAIAYSLASFVYHCAIVAVLFPWVGAR